MSESALLSNPNPTVLIVDDNPQNAELLAAFLESSQVRLVFASDGIDAMRAVTDENPDLILLDIMMPHMSGFQVCQRLKSNPSTSSIPILMLTALNEPSDIEYARECGANEFISKPIARAELNRRVNNLLKR